MNDIKTNVGYWLVGARWNEVDKTDEFVFGGYWENGYTDKYSSNVKNMKPGDKIAIKAAYTRKHNLPFDNRGIFVSVMSIKAIGVITDRFNDAKKVSVEWEKLENPKEWYFYTSRLTVWEVDPEKSWRASDLIDFTFYDKEQDIDKFRNDPFWKERFGDIINEKRNFLWSGFYQSIATALLKFKQNRTPLVSIVYDIVKQVINSDYLTDELEDGSKESLQDICPFTVFGTFNRGITDKNRTAIAKKLAEFLEVDEPAPVSFDGIPILNLQSSWFFHKSKDRQPNDINLLWEVFEKGIAYADGDNEADLEDFIDSYEKASKVAGVGWNLTMGLFWIRPWDFPTLDSRSRDYIKNILGFTLKNSGEGKRCSAREYLSIARKLNDRFQEEHFSVHSYPELSYAAWIYEEPETESGGLLDVQGREESTKYEGYSVEHIIEDGCFFPEKRIRQILSRLKDKKNIILQGPPGTGKTWLAKRLAFALMKKKDPKRLTSVQFHSNLSYEDFIRGYRPNAEGKLDLVEGPFLEVINKATDNPDQDYVIVIEEINRGNPAQVFGEMLTLLEADKRTPGEGLELCYRRYEKEKKYIPGNVFVIGTMNIADRSLALVDIAFRRRFAFINLEPTFGIVWRNWLHENFAFDLPFLQTIEQKILNVNKKIESDDSLGSQFKLGHSYLTPSKNESDITDKGNWFLNIVETEIEPILEEYWFDQPEKVNECSLLLREGLE